MSKYVGHWWLTPVILATQRAERAGGSWFLSQRKWVRGRPTVKRAGGEHLPSKNEALNSSPSNIKKKKKVD
jgi:hypothetical protein